MFSSKTLVLLSMFVFVVTTSTPENPLFNRREKNSVELYKSLTVLTKYSATKVKDEKYLKQIVHEAELVASKKGNEWLSPQELLGLALGESDLRWWVVTGKGTSYDCGICQNHTPIYARTPAARRRLCKLLQKSTYLSFVYAAHELNLYRGRYCTNPKSRHYVNKKQKNYKQKLYKCVFTLYNQGPNSRWAYNPYWLRILCYTTSIERGKYPVYPCRKMKNLRQLKYWLGRK